MAAYYNEIDPFAARWLRNLIKAGHIADGVVDERSILDVHPIELRGFTQCHFFAGVGVWSLALRLAGWPDNRAVWTGSCPCQPFSAAGKGGGFDDQRHLWPAWHHLIQERRPGVVFGEQVASKDGLGWLDLVQSDMEAEDYAFAAVDLCAAGVGAPHIRQRLWFVADTGRVGRELDRLDLGSTAGGGGGRAWEQWVWADGGAGGQPGGMAQSAGGERPGWGGLNDGRAGLWIAGPAVGGSDGGMADSQRPGIQVRADADLRGTVGHDEGRLVVESGHGGVRGLAHDDDAGQHRFAELRIRGADLLHADGCGPVRGAWAGADWIYCRDQKWRPVEPGTFPLAHGAASRVGRLRAYGNAINAEAAAAVINSFLDIELA